MPQAALPDLNTRWIMDTQELNKALKLRNYNAVFGYLESINAMLPDDYQVEISTEKYYEKITKFTLAVCSHCGTEHKRDGLPLKEVRTSNQVFLITSRRFERCWDCNKCNNQNLFRYTKIIKQELEEPHFFKIVPNAPTRTNSLTDRREYEHKAEKWAHLFKHELEHQMSRFRLEYKPKDQEVDEGSSMIEDSDLV